MERRLADRRDRAAVRHLGHREPCRRPTRSLLHFAGVTDVAGFDDYGFVLFRNSLVLALHALACVAGFIAGSSLPQWPRAIRPVAQSTSSPARWRSASWSARRSSRSPPRPTCWAATPSTLAASSGSPRPSCSASSRCTRCRSCSRCSCRWRRGRWRAARAAGRTCWPRRSSPSRSRSRCCWWPPPSRCGSRRSAARAGRVGRPASGQSAKIALYFLKRPFPTPRLERLDMAGSITEVTDTNFQAEVIEADKPGARRLLGALVRAVPRWSPRCSRRSPASATT